MARTSLVADEINGAAAVDIDKVHVNALLQHLGTPCHGIRVAAAHLRITCMLGFGLFLSPCKTPSWQSQSGSRQVISTGPASSEHMVDIDARRLLNIRGLAMRDIRCTA